MWGCVETYWAYGDVNIQNGDDFNKNVGKASIHRRFSHGGWPEHDAGSAKAKIWGIHQQDFGGSIG